METQKTLRDYLMLLAIGVVWGGQFLFNAQAVQAFPPITVAAARVLIGAITLSIVTGFISEPSTPHAKRSLSVGILFLCIALFEAVLPLFLIVWGQQHVDSSVTAVIIGSVPIITLILSVFMSKRKGFTVYSGLSVILGFIGIVVLVNPSAGGIGGKFIYEMAIFLGAVSFAFSLNLLERIPHSSPIRSVRNILWISSVPLVIAALVLDKPWLLAWNLEGALSVLVLGMIGSGLAYLMYASLTQRCGSVFTSLSNFIVPLVGVILGVAIRGEEFGSKEGLALVLIIAALAVNEAKLLFRKNVEAV
ncbi:DMT family transporter [Pseudomonas chlororaphis]|uniref:DMT family transporter n=1 Tax=Pseudomonas chlororaphis TaxID=587753 RepID=UPI001C60ABEB|nr:EamA family transporter [Pseudomonas chlororaphis]